MLASQLSLPPEIRKNDRIRDLQTGLSANA
jgi:hypothetical protein